MFFADLSPYTYYLQTPIETVTNVGWLDASQSYTKGPIEPAVLRKLEEIIIANDPVDVHVNRIRGVHPCALDAECGDLVVGDGKVGLGVSELWVPGTEKGTYFAAPSLIFHYMKEHGYKPPDKFLDAVISMNLSEPFKAQKKYIELVSGHF